tara:strand:- start:11705 stop:12619 length:915 start_codon:yes stop_codon:yes gene_type:complete
MRHMRVLELVDTVARAGSVRRAAEQLNFTASALTRRIQDLEAELDAKLFERTARGMRLTAAGELFVGHARHQLAEAERLRSGIEDLKGLRRGHVRIACSQAVALEFMPEAIGRFRRDYPLVDFEVRVVDHEQAERALASYEVDLVLVFSPVPLMQFQQLASLEQRLVALVPHDHPLAAESPLRLRRCAAFPAALPDRSTGGRQLLEAFSARTGIQFQVAVESNSFEMLRRSVIHSGLVSFQIEVGAVAPGVGSDIVVRAIDRRDTPAANLVLGQLRGRNLPVAPAVFAEHIVDGMAQIRAATQS